MNVGRKLNTLGRVLRQRGPAGVAYLCLRKLFPSGNVLLSWDARVLLRCPPPSDPQCGLGAFRLEEGQVSELAGVNALGESAVRAALDRGEQCWVLRQGEGIVAYAWMIGPATRLASDTGYPVAPQGRYAWWWRDAYVAPARRGQGFVAALFNCWQASLASSQRHEILTEVAPDNPASLRAHAKLGFVEQGRLFMLCVLGLRCYLVRAHGRPRLSFRFCPRNLHRSGQSI